jgi:hypothetical protein
VHPDFIKDSGVNGLLDIQKTSLLAPGATFSFLAFGENRSV